MYVGFGRWRNDAAHAFGERTRIGPGKIRGFNRFVHDEPDVTGIRGKTATQHDVPAADD